MRSRGSSILLAAVITVVVMVLLQRFLLVLPPVAALPAAALAGIVVAWRRQQRTAWTERVAIAASAGLLSAIADAVWMAGTASQMPTGSIVSGWLLTALVLTAVHSASATLWERWGGVSERVRSGRLR